MLKPHRAYCTRPKSTPFVSSAGSRAAEEGGAGGPAHFAALGHTYTDPCGRELACVTTVNSVNCRHAGSFTERSSTPEIRALDIVEQSTQGLLVNGLLLSRHSPERKPNETH